MSSELEAIDRRQFMRRVGATTLGAGAAYYCGSTYAGSPVQNGQAFVCGGVCVGGAAVAGLAAVGVGWALRDYEVLGSNPPAEGMTADAYRLQLYDTLRARKSNNQSTIIDNQNLIDAARYTAHADGKIAAIDSLNNQNTQSQVQSDAVAAVDEHHTTVVKNYFRSWNESVRELRTQVQGLEAHPNLGYGEFIAMYNPHNDPAPDTFSFSEITHQLPDGSDMQILEITIRHDVNGDSLGARWSPVSLNKWGSNPDWAFKDYGVTTNVSGYSQFKYLDREIWSPIVTQINDTFNSVKTGMSTYVNKVYTEVQSGQIDTSELLTPREQARIAGEEEGTPQALADLQALNISTDLEREAEVYLPDIGATIYGQLSYTGETQLEVGTVNPNETDTDGNEVYPGSFYFTYDISRGEGTWGEYNDGIDGGQLTFTSEPYGEAVYRIQTSAGETAEVTASDFTDNGDGTYTVDLSDQLDNAITTAETINYYSESGETQYETIQLSDPFEIKGFTDSEGNEYNKSDFERSEPQTDTNYITQEEWEAQQKRNEELIQKYEESQATTTGGDSFWSSLAIGPVPGEAVAGGVATIAAILFAK